jgi:hypothetical protein
MVPFSKIKMKVDWRDEFVHEERADRIDAMKLSDLIQYLNDLKEQHGDVECRMAYGADMETMFLREYHMIVLKGKSIKRENSEPDAHELPMYDQVKYLVISW